MKYGLSKINSFRDFKYENATEFVKTYWVKILILVFALFIILKKDISLNFNLQSAGSRLVAPDENNRQVKNAYPADVHVSNYNQPEAVGASMTFSKNDSKNRKDKKISSDQNHSKEAMPAFKIDESQLKEKPKKSTIPSLPVIKDNRANHFFNIAFILNPTYAERKKIDPEIVIQKNETCYQYVKTYSDIAIEEMKKYGIPASITLAQGLLESDAGGSRLARANNNHFGIKCFSKRCKKGHCANFTDDSHKDFFRKYKNVWESYRAHSIFLGKERYAHLKKLGTRDYKNWAHGLRKAGYATDKRYAEKLIKIIERMELYKYD